MTTRVPAIEQRAERNIRKWIESQKTQSRLAKRDLENSIGPYLALSRETGARGSEVAKAVAERLQWDLLDQEIVDYMQQHYGTPRCLIKRVDEKHENWLSSIITSRIGGLGFSETTFTRRVSKLLYVAAAHGDVVIVGRGARFVLPRDRGMSVRIVAPMEYRIQQITRQQGIGEKEARKFVLETDHHRNAYIKDHFGVNATDPHLYDMIVNVGDVTLDDAADMIADALNYRMRKVA